MAIGTLSETNPGTYIDSAGDIVFVFTDRDMKNKSLILQRDTEQGFGSFARMNDGYYKKDYAPYLPVRLFLPDIKRPSTPAYNTAEIELDGERNGAWVGDQGTLIIHRSEIDPDRTLHVMFSYDTHNEIKFVMYSFSPIFSRFRKEEKFRPIMEDELLTVAPVASNETSVSDHTRETFLDKLDDIQKQIDQMKEQISNATVVAQDASMHANACREHILKLEREQEHENTPNHHSMPDSNGFWRDKDGDIWAYDGKDYNPPIFLFDPLCNIVYDPHENLDASWSDLEPYAPFTKVDSPFPAGDNHAD